MSLTCSMGPGAACHRGSPHGVPVGGRNSTISTDGNTGRCPRSRRSEDLAFYSATSDAEDAVHVLGGALEVPVRSWITSTDRESPHHRRQQVLATGEPCPPSMSMRTSFGLRGRAIHAAAVNRRPSSREDIARFSFGSADGAIRRHPIVIGVPLPSVRSRS